MTVICSWCKKDLGEKEPMDDRRISHGMCPDCFEKQKEEIRIFWERESPAAVSAAG